MRRVVVEQGQRGHHRVQRQRPGVVGDDQRAAGRPARCSQAGRLDPEPLLVQRAERRGQHVQREVPVEAELVDLVVAGDPAAQERQAAGDPALPVRPRGSSAGVAAAGVGSGPRAGAAARRRRAAGSTRASPIAAPPTARRRRGRAGPRPGCAPSARRTAAGCTRVGAARGWPDHVVERRHGVVPRGVAELGAQPGRVHHPAELQEPQLLAGEVEQAGPAYRPADDLPPAARHRDRHPPGPAHHLGQQQHPGAADVHRAGPVGLSPSRSTSSASSACSSCTRGSKPSTVGTTGSRR